MMMCFALLTFIYLTSLSIRQATNKIKVGKGKIVRQRQRTKPIGFQKPHDLGIERMNYFVG